MCMNMNILLISRVRIKRLESNFAILLGVSKNITMEQVACGYLKPIFLGPFTEKQKKNLESLYVDKWHSCMLAGSFLLHWRWKVRGEFKKGAKFFEKLSSTLSPMNLTYILFVQNNKPFSKHARKNTICLSVQQYQDIMMERIWGKWGRLNPDL